MSNTYHLGFTPEYLGACTDLKLRELQDGLLRQPSPDRRDDLEAVAEELAKRQNQAREGLAS